MARIAFLGDSLTATGLDGPLRTINSWLSGPVASILGPQFTDYINHGAGGETSDQCLARVPAVIADAPDLVVINCGINDLTRPDTTFEMMQSTYLDIIAQLVRADIRVVCCTILDRRLIADGGAVPPEKAIIRPQFNAWLRELRKGTMVEAVADLDTIHYDPLQHSDDATHPNTDRCWAMAGEIANAVRVAAVGLPSPNLGTNLLGRGEMLGTTGLTSAGYCNGTLPEGWRVIGGSTGTVSWACSVDHKDKSGATRIDLSGTPSGTARSGFLRRTAPLALTAGQRIIVGFDLKLEAVQGVVGVMCQLSLPYGAGTQYLSAMQHRSDTDQPSRQVPPNYNERLWSLPYTVTEDTTTSELRFGIYYLDDAALSGRITIGDPVIMTLT